MREEVEPIWRGEFSQIYPALARLRREGLVLLRLLGPRRGPRRNLYRVSAAGRRELRRWLLESPPPPRPRDEGLARMALLDLLTPSERRVTLLQYERALLQEMRRLRSAPAPSSCRRQARRAVIESLEAIRRWIRTLTEERSETAGSVTEGTRPGGKRK